MAKKARSRDKNPYLGVIWLILGLIASLLVFYILQSYVALEYPVVKLFSAIGYVDSFGKTMISGTDVIIDSQCSGFFSIFVYLALIFSPITLLSFRKKLKAFIFGFIILYLANIIRLFLIFWFAKYLGINFMHVFGWILMSVIIFALWYYYNFKTAKSKSLQK